MLLVTADTPTAIKLEKELDYFLQGANTEVQLFPDWETLPYDVFSPHQDIISQRLKTLYQLPRLSRALVIVPVSTALLRICNRDHLEQHSFIIKRGQQVDLAALKRQLAAVGYRSVEQVMEHGEFSARGSILDLYPMGATSPYRIDFFDNDVDGIRTFDPDNQRSLAQVDAIELLPAHEFPTDQAAIERFRLAYRERFAARNEKESLYQQVSQGMLPAGIEYYLPLFAQGTATLFDYLPAHSRFLLLGDTAHSAAKFWHELRRRFDDRAIDLLRPILPPAELYLSTDQLFAALKAHSRIRLSQAELPQRAGSGNLAASLLPELGVNHQLKNPLQALQQFILKLKQQQGRAAFFVESEGRRESLLQL